MSALLVRDVWAAYGQAACLHGVTFEAPKGSVVALLGANGAGKTSALRAVAGMLSPSRGAIEWDGRRIDGARPDAIVRAGIAHVPEGRHIFAGMTVMENLRLGAYVRHDAAGVRRDLDRVLRLFPVLAQRREQQAGLLSGGEQQMLAIGRALMSGPRLLLLDEPSIGLAPRVVREIFEAVAAINREGVTIVLAEQNANLALDLATTGYVIENGRVALSEAASALRGHEDVRRAYLGY
nr:hypothetical protein AMJ38_04840 [uncultured bacterium]